jgi:hypothetical protein
MIGHRHPVAAVKRVLDPEEVDAGRGMVSFLNLVDSSTRGR